MNKLGFYLQNSQGTHEHISNVQPPVILIHAWDQGLLMDIRRFRAPDAFVVGRMEYIGQGENKRAVDQSLVNSWLDGDDPAARGREFAEHILADNFQLATRKGENGRLLVDAWMSLNECIPGPASGGYSNSAAEREEIERRLRAYDKFQAAFRAKLMEQGVEAVAFNFGAGNFTSAAHYLDFFPETLASYTYLGFHEYGWPAMRGDAAAGIFSSAGTYRPIVTGIRQQTGRDYKAIITEAGLARMFKHSSDGAGDVGWLYPEDSISQDDYWRSLDWFNDYLVEDDFAVGACLFQVGVGAGWQTFRHSGQDAAGNSIQILERVRQLRDKTDHQPQPTVGETETPPVETPPVETPPVETPPVDPPIETPPDVTPPPGGTHTIFLPIVSGSDSQSARVPVAEKLGLDANRPIDPANGVAAAQVEDPEIIADTGVGWVRINFVLGQTWPSVADPGWQECYSQIIAGFRNRGLKVYGLIGDEALSAPPGDQFRSAPPEGAAQDEWLDRYVDAFVAIARRFRLEVTVFESFNEPDDWHGGNSSWIHPGWYAVMLQSIHDRVRSDPLLKHLILVSGPLQGLHNDEQSNNNNGGARYLAAAYLEGKQRFGWGSSTPFPFDGVGYHLYVAQSPASSEAQILAKLNEHLSAFCGVIRQAEGRDRPVYLSEFGWFSNGGNEAFQERSMRVGLKAALNDPSLALVVWFCIQDFGEESELKHYGLYRQGAIGPESRKTGVYGCFQEILATLGNVPITRPAATVPEEPVTPAQPEARIPRIYTNQQAIDAAFNTAKKLGLADQWALLVKAGQDVNILALNRKNIYTGPALDETPSLTASERSVLRAELLEQLVMTMRWEGLVTATAGLSLRVGPGAEHTRLRYLAHEEKVQVLDDSGEWLFVLAEDTPGYVSAQWVMRQILPTPVPPAPSGDVETLLRTWTRHQQLLTDEAARLGIDPAVAVAVLLAESGGDGFGADGRLKIRFENHVFLQQWGAQNKPVFDRFFSFNAQVPWTEHRWRPNQESEWESCHQSQTQEWQVLDFARNFVEEPALNSISMGAAQIMGFNFATVGYGSAREMFDDFQSGEVAQIRALFRYVENRNLVLPLRQGDYVTFAAGFNGPGQAEFYAGIIQKYIELFLREIRGERRIGLPTAVESVPGTRGLEPMAGVGGDSVWQNYIQTQLAQSQAQMEEARRAAQKAADPALTSRKVLLGMGVLSFVAALLLAFFTRSQPLTAIGLALVFGGLSTLLLLVYAFIDAQPRTDGLSKLLWLQVLSNSYWSRLAGLPSPVGADAKIVAITQETVAGIKELLATPAKGRGKPTRPQ